MQKQNMFTGSNPDGYRAEIRQCPDGFYSCFTWFDTDKTGIIMWKEKHDLQWQNAFEMARDHLNTELFKG